MRPLRLATSNGRVWVAFWKFVCNSHVGVGNMEGQLGKALNCGVAFVKPGHDSI